MSPLISFFKKRPHLLLLGLILIIGILFRTYKLINSLDFGHDADLYSWIVKDIIVNHHFRLIGQLTSAPGIFIGPLFYYLLVPFFIFTKMDPAGAIIPVVILGILTILSYYFVLSRLFSKKIGLISTFLYAVLFSAVSSDRWVVPTVTTAIWSIWYLFFIIKLCRKDFSVLPFLGILIGLIWHIHVALAPVLLTIPIALIFAGKIPKLKQIFIFLLIISITSIPFIMFEARHNFSQTKSIISNFTANFGKGNNISENKEIIFGKQNDNAKINLDTQTQFSLEIEPQAPKIGDTIDVKITSKNPKYSTIVVLTDCGNPKKFETGSNIIKFQWSTKNCPDGNHKIIAQAQTKSDSFLKKISDKFLIVIDKENTNIINLLITPAAIPRAFQYLVSILILLSPLLIWRIKFITNGQFAIFYTWILAVLLFFSLSSIPVSEYYLASFTVIFISCLSIILSKIYQIKRFGKYLVLILLLLLLINNFLYYLNFNNYNKGYIEKKAVVQYITKDAKQKGYPCIGISYITNIGEDTGFRYLFFLKNQHLVHPSPDVPIYNIVVPDELSREVKQKFGHIGVIPPTELPSKEIIDKKCQEPNSNLTDPVFGYVE